MLESAAYELPAVLPLTQMVREKKTTGLSLAVLLNLTFVLDATDPRDKIFALLGLLDSAEKQQIHANYGRQSQDIYAEVTSLLIASSASFDLLAIVNHPKSLVNLPSWVPDWTNKGQGPSGFSPAVSGTLSVFHSRKRDAAGPPKIEGRALLVHGLVLDTISSIGEQMGPDWSFYTVLLRWTPIITKSAQARSQSIPLTFIRLVLADNGQSKEREAHNIALHEAFLPYQ